jgi:DNA polymerase III epsilon subunit-like protein
VSDGNLLACDCTITVVDFECTGTVEGHADQPWELGLVLFERGHPVPGKTFRTLLHVDQRPFSPYAPGRHEQVRAAIAAAPDLPGLWSSLKPWLIDRPLCAHNVGTERKFIRKAFAMHRIGPWIDTLRLVRFAYPHLPSHKLEDVLVTMGLKQRADGLLPGLGPHDALYDAMACALVLEALLELPEWKDISLEALVQVQAGPSPRPSSRKRPTRQADP